MEKILVVEDSLLNREVIKSNLASAGYAVIEASSGDEAVRVCTSEIPDLVLLDILMPGMNGFDTCRAIRILSADVPIVFLSALKDLESNKEALEAGGDDVLTKPINRSELLLRTRSMLWLKRLRTELRSGYNLISTQRDVLILAQQQKQELIDLVVHDLKSPLTVVMGFAQHLASHPAIMKDEEINDNVQRILNSTDMMQRMVINMLDISQSESGSLKPNIAQVSVTEIVAGVCQAMALKARSRKVALEASAPQGPILINADESLLRRMLDNLVENALRYTPANGKVKIEVRDAKTAKGSQLDIRVSDEGPGIPKEDRESVFEKFVRLDTSNRNRGAFNHGLGLTFCKLAAKVHGGEIWIEANEPKGSCFCVTIPYSDSNNETTPIITS